MIDPVKQLAKYIRDLLGLEECFISLGRDNKYDNQKDLLIIVDDLSPAIEKSVTKSYDGSDNVEKQTINSNVLGQFTVNFYGNKEKARENAFVFSTLKYSESARTLQKTHGISIYRTSTIVNLKQLAGKTYHERYEITLNIGYNITNELDVLRFDEAQFSFLVDN
jgi:hypothetical protein